MQIKKDFYQLLMAKTNPESEEEWLPLWIHLRDTAEMMRQLVRSWVPEAVFCAAGLEYEDFYKTAVFLAAIHDIGKATSYFQSIITKFCPEKYQELTECGVCIHKRYRSAGKTPHAWAGQWILQSSSTEWILPKGLAEIVGAHHGKPNGDWERDLVKQYPINFFGVEESDLEKKEDKSIWLWKEAWREIVTQALALAGISSLKELPDLTVEAQVLLSGLLIMADWIASNTTYFPLLLLEEYGENGYYPERVHTAWEKLSFSKGWNSQQYQMDEEQFEKRFGFLPNEVQRAMLRIINESKEPGIFILEAQMGVGKTEAALGAAEILACRRQESGLFFGLPTQATSNGIFGRLCEWGRKVSEETVLVIRLAHQAAELQEEYHKLMLQGKAYVDIFCAEEEEEDSKDSRNTKKDENSEKDSQKFAVLKKACGGLGVHPWFQGNKRALLADFVVGTVDQFLMASLKRKHFMLRHIGLAGKVIIIDECHAYDAYMNEYLERSLEWMAAYGVPIILLSATLPAERRSKLIRHYVSAYSKYYLKKQKPEPVSTCLGWKESIQYPLLTWTDGETIRQEAIQQDVVEKRVKIRYIDSVSAMLAYLEVQLQEGGCACVIANTVKQAQYLYERCQETLEDVTLLLYHAQFLLPDRARKEEELLKRVGKSSKNSDRNRLIVIGTQVLEQSLDYDADIMVTQLCPMDLLLQRIGRLHRHKERDKGKEGYSRPKRLQIPECVILQEKEEAYDAGTKAVYGDYLLMRTAKVLKKEIILPGELPYLVQMVYNEADDLGLTGEMYEKAIEQHQKLQKEKTRRADEYRIPLPPRKRGGLGSLLRNAETSSEKVAEASVRDSDGSLEVLLMKRNAEGMISFVGEEAEREKLVFELLSAQMPDDKMGRKIASQRLRLPHVFTASWSRRQIIQELEERNRQELPEWQLSPWIHGELVLMLEENNQGRLGDYLLRYSYEKGLEYEERKEERNARENI